MYGSRPEGDKSPLETQNNVLPFLSACTSIAPTFMSLGNHEWMVDQEDLRLLSSTGVTVLDNSFQSVTMGNRVIVIGGLTSGYVTDYRAFRSTQPAEPRYPRREDIAGVGGAVHAREHKPETGWLEEYCSAPGHHVLLSHHPDYWALLRKMKIDLVLSGHAHGGQIRIFNHGLWCPGQGFWPRWTRGVYDGRLVVSAGLSNTTWIPRLFNPREIVYINTIL